MFGLASANAGTPTYCLRGMVTVHGFTVSQLERDRKVLISQRIHQFNALLFFKGANSIQIVAIPSFSSLHRLVCGNWGHLGPS